MATGNKLEILKKLCVDTEYRSSLFSRPDSQILIQKLQLRDFPVSYLLECPPFELEKSLLSYSYKYSVVKGRRDRRTLNVDPETQLIALDNLLEGRQEGNSVTIISGITDFQKARFITFLLLFCKLLSRVHTISYLKPLWYYVKGGFDDKLRESEDYRSQKGSLDYLVLDGLATSSSKLKLEKFNDIVASYKNSAGNTDIIIIAAGFDPLQVAAEQLNISFQSGLYFDEGLIVNV